MQRLFFLSLLFCWVVMQTNAQSDEKLIENLIKESFSAMYEGDGARFAQCFYPSATITRMAMVADSLQTNVAALSKFEESINGFEKGQADERVTSLQVHVDGPMAMAWVGYDFYLNGALDHCGVNALTLTKEAGSWKIAQIVYTDRNDCGN